MSEPDNIECFSLATRAVLSRLLAAFPRPISLNSAKLQNEAVHNCEMPASCAWKEGSSCLMESTLEYLSAEGVIRFSEKSTPIGIDDHVISSDFVWHGVVLTSKGFSVLNRPFPESSQTSGQTLAKAIRSSGSLVGKSAVTEAVRLMFQAL
jgi:hypothetical protein